MTEALEAQALLPCPFCGADTASYVTGDCEYTTCDTCLAEGPPCETQEEAARLWNTRTPATPDRGEDTDMAQLVALIHEVCDSAGAYGNMVHDTLLAGVNRLAANRAQGWRLVPVEPTEEMLRAGAGVWLGGIVYMMDEAWLERMRQTWSPMLSAAPTPPFSTEVEHG